MLVYHLYVIFCKVSESWGFLGGGLICFLLLSCRSSLLRMPAFSQTCLVDLSSQSLRLAILFLMVFLSEQVVYFEET